MIHRLLSALRELILGTFPWDDRRIGYRPCPACDGSGLLVVECLSHPAHEWVIAECADCHGTGQPQ